MFGRQLIKEIKGKVYIDAEADEHLKNSRQNSVGNVGIRLYRLLGSSNKNKTRMYENLNIYEKCLVLKTRTNKDGLFRFYVPEGRYTVETDLGTIPKGVGLIDNNILVDIGERKNINFCARKINSIEVDNLNRDFYLGDCVDLNPVPKDKYGNILFADIDITSENSKIVLNGNRLKVNEKVYEETVAELNMSSGEVSKRISLNFKLPEINSIHKTREAFENGFIDENRKILNYLYSLFDKSRLDDRYKSRSPLKSGTTAVKEIHDYIGSEHADENIVKTAKRYLSSAIPELDRTYKTQSGYFSIHYTTTGKNAVSTVDNNRNGIPDYIELVGNAFEQVKKITCDIRGFSIPLLEEGKSSFDVNVFNLEGKYGLTYPLTFFERGENKRRRASCSICIDNNYSSDKGFKKEREGCVKVTAAHEFFHAVQYAYNVDSASWWKEASATWNEDEIYDEVNDYFQYLDGIFSSPENSLEKSSYGGVIFVKYLAENYGGYNIIKRIWEKQGTKFDSSINSIDTAIRELYPNESLETAFDDYTAWNFNPSQFYREGSLWSKTVYVKSTYNSYPVSTQIGQLNHLSANYILFKPLNNEHTGNLRISIAENMAKWGFKIQRKRASDNLCEIVNMGGNDLGNGREIICQGFGDNYSEVCFIPACLEKEKDGKIYSFSANLK